MPRFSLSDRDIFERFLADWTLEPDGAPIFTHSSQLLPVRRDDERLMLKVAIAPEERQGNLLLAAWQKGPFVRVIDQKDDAVLMARAEAQPLLKQMAEGGQDSEATGILCDLARQIHQAKPPPIALTPLKTRFADLWTADGSSFDAAKRAARRLLDEDQPDTPLHGDLHHGNVLHFGSEGWRAIDPKGVIGARGFDYANMLCNLTPERAALSGRFETQLGVIADASGIDATELSAWVVAWTGLSAVWSMQSGDDPRAALEIGKIAAASC